MTSSRIEKREKGTTSPASYLFHARYRNPTILKHGTSLEWQACSLGPRGPLKGCSLERTLLVTLINAVKGVMILMSPSID